MGRTDFSDQFRKMIIRYKRIGYNLTVMRQSACLVIMPITVDSFAALFNCTPADRALDSMMARPKAIHVRWLGLDLFRLLLVTFFCSSGVVWHSMIIQLSCNTLYLLCPRVYFFIVVNHDLQVNRDDSLIMRTERLTKCVIPLCTASGGDVGPVKLV